MSGQAGQPGVYSSAADALLQLLGILIAKGDILTRNDSDQLVRVPVGLDGQQLTANSADPNGIDWQAGTVAPVASVFSRVGAVVAALGDYDASQVDNDSGVAGATVKDALDTLAGVIVALAASDITNDSGVAGATVKDALDTLAGLISGGSAVLIFGANNVASGDTLRYLFPGGADTQAETDPGAPDFPNCIDIPRAGTLRRLYVRHNIPRGNSRRIVHTVRKNGIATALSATLISDTDHTGNDLVNSVAVSQGDRIDIEISKPDGDVGTSPLSVYDTLEFL
jgi:hypothetical protein